MKSFFDLRESVKSINDTQQIHTEQQLDEISQDTLSRYHAKAGTDRMKAKREADKGLTAKKYTPDSIQKTADAYKRFVKRGKGMTAAAKRMKEEVDQIEEAMSSAHKKLAYDVHKQLKRDNSMALGAGLKLKADHKMLRSKYGSDWRKKAGIKEAVEEVDQIEEATDQDLIKFKQLARLGLVDKSEAEKLVLAFKRMKEDKPLSMQQRSMLLGIVGDLISIVVGDPTTFMKAKKAVAEEVEQVDELNKSTLASYTQKAAGSLAGNAAAAGYAGGQGKKTHPDIQRFMKNRMKGIQHAAKKLAKEDVDQVSEISQATKDTW